MEGRKDTADLIRSETEVLAPDILLKTRSGETVRLRTLYNEKPVCLYFWHPWTEYSREGLDTLEDVKKKTGDSVYICAVMTDGTAADGYAYIDVKKYDFLSYHTDIRSWREFIIKSPPVWIIIDKGGRIKDKADSLTELQILTSLAK